LTKSGLKPEELRFTWYYYGTDWDTVVPIIQANLAQVGIQVELAKEDYASNLRRRKEGQHILALGWWSMRPDPERKSSGFARINSA
jgi:ABC-type transport system substrate-binding protein